MAYIDDPNADDEEQNGKKADDGSNAGSQLSAGSGLLQQGQTSGGGANPDSKPSTSGSWTNLKSYLDANQEGASKEGTDVSGKLNDESSTAKSLLDSDVQGFNSQVGKNTVNYDQDLFGQVSNDPTSVASDDGKFQAIQKALDGSYTGPSDLSSQSDWNDTTSKVNNASTDVGQIQSEAGRQALLQGIYTRPDYNQGEQNLDQLLLEQSPNAQKSLSDTYNQWSGLTNSLTGAQSQAAQTAQQAQATNANTASQAKKTLNDTASTFGQSAAKQAQADYDQGQQDYSAIVHALANGSSVPSQYASDLQPLVNQNYYGLDPSQFVQANANQPAASQSLTASQVAELTALNKLAGGHSIDAINQLDQTYGTSPSASTYKGYTVNDPSAAIGAQKSALIDELQAQANAAIQSAAAGFGGGERGQIIGSLNNPAAWSTNPDFQQAYQLQAAVNALRNGGDQATALAAYGAPRVSANGQYSYVNAGVPAALTALLKKYGYGGTLISNPSLGSTQI